MRDIAARAGVSQSLLHHHFGTKETLWNFVGGRIAEDFFSYMAGAIAAEVPVEESIPRVLRSYMMYWQEHPAAFRFNLWRLLDGPTDERQKRSKAISERSVPVFQRAQRSGFVRKDMPAGLTMIVAGSLVQFWLHSQIEMRDALAITGHESMGDEAFLQHVLGLILTEPSSKETSQRNGKGHRIKGKRGKGS
jgi:TetR/AcrR family transcriptional regulator